MLAAAAERIADSVAPPPLDEGVTIVSRRDGAPGGRKADKNRASREEHYARTEAGEEKPGLPSIPDGTFLVTPDQHRAAAQLRPLAGDPKAQELAACRELLARVIQKRLDEQVPPLAPR
jgi:hypothetical protein